MTPQEILWKDVKVLVVSILSKNNKVHMKHKRMIGRTGVVVQEAKNNMLLVRFNLKYGRLKFVAIPASCLFRL